jgi:ribosomal protein S18 acetylase RimI-like enzyme
MTVRIATTEDEGFLVAHRRHIAADLMRAKVASRQVYVAESNGQIVGWARYGLFWDNLPFLNMIYILDNYRGRGIGSALMSAWEQDMAAQGHRMVLTSTQSDEDAQHFYRRLGYRDCGVLVLPGEAGELMLLKELALREDTAK